MSGIGDGGSRDREVVGETEVGVGLGGKWRIEKSGLANITIAHIC